MSRPPTSPFLRRLARAPVALYRWRLGWLLGHQFILLVHVGRQRGLERRTVLEVVHYDPDTSEVVVMSGFRAHLRLVPEHPGPPGERGRHRQALLRADLP